MKFGESTILKNFYKLNKPASGCQTPVGLFYLFNPIPFQSFKRDGERVLDFLFLGVESTVRSKKLNKAVRMGFMQSGTGKRKAKPGMSDHNSQGCRLNLICGKNSGALGLYVQSPLVRRG